MSKAKKGIKRGSPSAETRKKQSEWQKGKPKPSSPETLAKKRAALLGKTTWMKGRSHTAESLQLMSQSQKARIRKPAPKHSLAAIENNRQGQLKFIYTVQSPSGEQFIFSDMKAFCKMHNLPYQRLADKRCIGLPIRDSGHIKNKSHVGWVVINIAPRILK